MDVRASKITTLKDIFDDAITQKDDNKLQSLMNHSNAMEEYNMDQESATLDKKYDSRNHDDVRGFTNEKLREELQNNNTASGNLPQTELIRSESESKTALRYEPF